MIKWIKTSEKEPPFGSHIFVYSTREQKEKMIHYAGKSPLWGTARHCSLFPFWRFVNDTV